MALTKAHNRMIEGAAVNVKDFGAVGDGVTDDTAAIQAAIDTGADAVYIPNGIFAHSGIITITGARLFGEGTLLSTDSSTPPSHAIVLTGTGPSIIGLTIDSTWSGGRQTVNNAAAILVSSASDFLVSDCKVNKSAQSGIFITSSSVGRAANNLVENTLADGIHNTDGSNNISIVGNVINNSGDDSIAVVGYAAQSTQVSTFTITGNVSNFSNARGIAAIGAANVTISGNTVFAADKGGIRAAAESFYNTYPCTNILITGNSIIDPNTSSGTIIGGISVSGYSGFLAENITVNGNTLSYTGDRNCYGPSINISNIYGVNPVICNNTIYGNASHNNSGINLECTDAIITGNTLKDLSRSGILVPAAAYGTFEILNNILINCDVAGSASDAPIYVAYSSNVDKIKIENNCVRDSSESIQVITGYDATQIRLFNNLLENQALGERIFDGEIIGSDYIVTLSGSREQKVQSVAISSSDNFKVIANGNRHSPVHFTFQGVARLGQHRVIMLEEFWIFSFTTGGGVLGTDYVALTSGGYYVRTPMTSFFSAGLGTFSMTEDGANNVTVTFNPAYDCQFNARINPCYKAS